MRPLRPLALTSHPAPLSLVLKLPAKDFNEIILSTFYRSSREIYLTVICNAFFIARRLKEFQSLKIMDLGLHSTKFTSRLLEVLAFGFNATINLTIYGDS